MSNNCKVGKALNVQLGRLMIMMKLKAKQFYRIMDLSGVCGMFDSTKIWFHPTGTCLTHMGFKTVAHAGSEFTHASSSMSQGT